MRPRLYLAGPLGLPSIIGWPRVLANVERAEAAAMQLVGAGWSPIVPHGNARWPGAFDIEHAVWLEIDEALLDCCRYLVRLPGQSAGADHEEDYARQHGILVLTLEQALRYWPR